jgi:hypothetical protein
MSKKSRTPPKTAAASSFGFFYDSRVHYVLLAAAGLILYGWTAGFDFGLDDDYVLTYLAKVDNTWTGFVSIFKMWYANSDYRPVTILTFWLQRKLFDQITPFSSHLLNVIFYILAVLALYKLILASRFVMNEKTARAFALLASLIFLVHPNHVSVVANIKSRDNILSMLFGALAAIQSLRFYDKKRWRQPVYTILSGVRKNIGVTKYESSFLSALMIAVLHLALIVFLYVLALLSKLDAYAFIFYPLLVLFLYHPIGRKKMLIAIAATLLLFLITIGIRSAFTSDLNQELNTFRLGYAETPLTAHSTIADKLSLALTTTLYYLKFLFVPFGYYFYYGNNQIPLRPLFSPLNVASAIICIALLCASVYYYRKNKIYLFALAFYFLAIAYALNFFNAVGGIVMDRYNFIPSIAFCIAFSALSLQVSKTKDLSVLRKVPVAVILIVLTAFSFYRTADWKNSFTLFDKDLPHLAKSVNANRIAAGTYIHIALQEEMKPNYDRNFTDSFIDKGRRYALIALRNSDKTPAVWELLGLCDFYHKDFSGALDKFRHCYILDSTYLTGINYIGYTHWSLGNIDSAQYYFKYVINREPFFNFAANNMVDMLVQNHRTAELDSLFDALTKKYPDDPRLQQKINQVGRNSFPLPRK